MHKLIYTATANEDLIAIHDYIAKDNLKRANDYLLKIEKTILKLPDFPELGTLSRYLELRSQEIRMLPHDKYLIFYTIDRKREIIYILRVLNGAKNYKNLF